MKGPAFRMVLFLFCLFWVFGAPSTGTEKEPPSKGLTASIVPPSARVGDTVTLILHYILSEGARLPEKAGIKGLEGLTILGMETIPSKGAKAPSGEAPLSGEIRINLLVDQLETLTTGPLSVAFLDREGEEAVLNAPPVSLKVLSNLGEKPEEAQLRPIYDIIPIGFRWKNEILWGAAILLFCLLAGFFWWRRKKGGAKAAQETPRILPHLAARESIAELEREKLFEQGQIKAFYFRFSEILRRYLEELRGFPAVEFTTQEIALALKDPKDRELLPLLRQADLVKFADYRPAQGRKEEEVKKALGYIDHTCESFGKDLSASSKKEKGGALSIRRKSAGGRRFT